MAEPLKNGFDARVVEQIARMISGAHPSFPAAAFTAAALRGLDGLELLDRGVHVAAALRAHLPAGYDEALAILVRSLGPPLPEAEEGFDGLGQGMAPFVYLPHVAFVRDHGLGHLEPSLAAQRELTRRFTAEWSIRPFLEHHPERTLAVLARWVEDPSCHVRRLVSEGTRPRLPWAPRLRRFQEDPGPALSLLERLKDDPSEYVRRSVANHLNDVGKDHPAVLVEVARRWLLDASPERRRLVRHALRTLVKQGHPEALALLGFGAAPRVDASARVAPARVQVGGAVTIRVRLRSRSTAAQDLVVDLAVHFVKASGATRPKVFKLRTLRLGPRAEAVLEKRVSLAPMSTRVHHPGAHRVEIRVNGTTFPGGSFRLVPAPPGREPPPAPRRPPRRLSRRAR